MEDKTLEILKKRRNLELLKECPRCFTIVEGKFNFCIYCGVKLRIRSNSKEMEKTIVKKLNLKNE